MKFLLSGSAVSFLIVLSFLQGSITSCTKETIIHDTVTVNRTDTVVIKDTVLTVDILTSHPWKFQEFIGVWGADSIYYERGGSFNTYNYDSDYIVFYTDGTGNHHDAEGYDHMIKEWQFTNDAHTQMTFKYYNLTIEDFFTWDNIRYKNKAIRFDEYFHDNYININVHDQTVRIPQ